MIIRLYISIYHIVEIFYLLSAWILFGNILFNISLNFVSVSNWEKYGGTNDRKNITMKITGAGVLNPFSNTKLLGKSYNTTDESNGEQYSVHSKKDSYGCMSKPHVLLPGL